MVGQAISFYHQEVAVNIHIRIAIHFLVYIGYSSSVVCVIIGSRSRSAAVIFFASGKAGCSCNKQGAADKKSLSHNKIILVCDNIDAGI